jgi:hypothetical protein
MSTPPINVGINNSDSICWLSTLIQMLIHLPEFPVLMVQANDCLNNVVSEAIIQSEQFKKMKLIINTLCKILTDLSGRTLVYDLSKTDYDIIMSILLPDQIKGAFQDFEEPLQLFFGRIDDLLGLLKGTSSESITKLLEIIQLIKLRFLIYSTTQVKVCVDTSQPPKILPQEELTILKFIKMDTPDIICVEELIILSQKPMLTSMDIGSINYCTRLDNYKLSNKNKYLLIGLNNYLNKHIYINSIISINKEETDKSVIMKHYIINGLICYNNYHYYYVSFSDKGIPQYEYNDNDVSEVINISLIYNQAIMIIYVPYEETEIEQYKELMAINYRLFKESFQTSSDIEENKKRNIKKKEIEKDLHIEKDKFLQLEDLKLDIKLSGDITESLIQPTTVEKSKKIYRYFFNSLPSIPIGKSIIQSIPDKELYDLFYMGDSMKQKYNKSIVLSTQEFKTTFNNDTKSTDKEVDVENIYNTREQLFTTNKKKIEEKYSMFYYNTNDL